MNPIAFIDIDGVLNRLVSNKVAKSRKLVRHHGRSAGFRWPLWLDRDDKGRIETLSEHFEPAWGTTWQLDAYPQVGKPLGLQEFEIVAYTDGQKDTFIHGKAPGVVRAADGRPFVWLEDDYGYEDVLKELDIQQPYLFIRVEPQEGLTDEHIQTAIDWSETL